MSEMTSAGLKIKSLLGLEVACTYKEEALNVIARRFSCGEKTLIVYANTNLLSALRKINRLGEISSKCIVLNDGLGIDIISVILGKPRFPENLNGTDFTLQILLRIGLKSRVYCFGSEEIIVKKAASELKRLHSICVVGSTHGFISKPAMELELIEAINDTQSDIVLVGLGNTRQEEWMLANVDRLSAKIIICVGAFFDFTAGAVYRAPLWARYLRMEWLFRLLQEPTRLWRRYSIDPLALAFAALLTRLTGRNF